MHLGTYSKCHFPASHMCCNVKFCADAPADLSLSWAAIAEGTFSHVWFFSLVIASRFQPSRKHDFIVLTTLNPSFI